MFTFILVIHVIAAFLLIFIVLLQPGKTDAGAAFAGTSSANFGSSEGNVLTKGTMIFATVFMLTSISLAYLSSNQNAKSMLKGYSAKPAAQTQVPAPVAPAASAAPAPASSNLPTEPAKK